MSAPQLVFENHTNARMQTCPFLLLTAHWQPQQVQRVSLSKLVPTCHCKRFRKRTGIIVWPNMQQTKEQKVKPMFLKARIVNERDGFILADMIVMIVTSLVTFEWPLAQVGSMAQATRR